MTDPGDMSHRQVVEHIARRALTITGALEAAQREGVVISTGGKETPPKPAPMPAWEDLEPGKREDARQLTYAAMRHPGGTLTEVWADHCEHLEETGWKRGFVQNDAARETPLLRPFGEIPLADRQALAVFITAVRAMYE